MTLKDEPITIEIDDDEPEERSKTINAMLPPPPPPPPPVPSSRTSGAPSRWQHGTPCSTPSSMAAKPKAAVSMHHSVSTNVVSSTSTTPSSRPGSGGGPHLLTDNDLLSLITDLELPNDRAVLLIDRLCARNLIDSRSVLIAGKRPAAKMSSATGSPVAPIGNGANKRFKHHQLC